MSEPDLSRGCPKSRRGVRNVSSKLMDALGDPEARGDWLRSKIEGTKRERKDADQEGEGVNSCRLSKAFRKYVLRKHEEATTVT